MLNDISGNDSACSVGATGVMGSIAGSEISTGEGNGNPLQYSCLKNPMDRGAWYAIVHRVTKSWTQLKWMSTQNKWHQRFWSDYDKSWQNIKLHGNIRDLHYEPIIKVGKHTTWRFTVKWSSHLRKAKAHEHSLNIYWKDWRWSSSTLATWCEELTHEKRPWCWERLKAGGEGDDREWDGWMASLTQWTWVWASSGRWWRTRKAGILLSMGWQRVRHDWEYEQQSFMRKGVTFCKNT